MTEREKKSEMEDEMQTNRGGRKEGGVPNYEKNQSSPNDDKDFDNSKTSW